MHWWVLSESSIDESLLSQRQDNVFQLQPPYIPVSTCQWKEDILDGSSITQSNVPLFCLETQPNDILNITFSLMFTWEVFEWPLAKNIKILMSFQVAALCSRLRPFRSRLFHHSLLCLHLWLNLSGIYLRGGESTLRGKADKLLSAPLMCWLFNFCFSSCLLCCRARMPCPHPHLSSFHPPFTQAVKYSPEGPRKMQVL